MHKGGGPPLPAASSVFPTWPQAGSHSGDGSTGGRAEAGIGGALPPPTCTLRTVSGCTRLSRTAARRPSPAPRAESPAGGRPAAASGAPPSPERGARLESTRAAPQAALARGRLTADCAPAQKTPPQHVNVGGGRAPASGQTTISSLCLPWETQASPHDTSPSWPGARSHRPVRLSAGCGAGAPRSADEPAPPVGSRACLERASPRRDDALPLPCGDLTSARGMRGS